jgi:hypothetical protein
MNPLINKWRCLGGLVIVFYDDGMLVGDNHVKLQKMSVEVQCDLLCAGLVLGVQKCIWQPCKIIELNGLKFDFYSIGITIFHKRIESSLQHIDYLLSTVDGLKRHTGKLLNVLYNWVLCTQFFVDSHKSTRMLQTFVNVQHYCNDSWGGKHFCGL